MGYVDREESLTIYSGESFSLDASSYSSSSSEESLITFFGFFSLSFV